MAKVASVRSVCKSRQVGAVTVDIGHYVLSTGYNGPAKGTNECDPCKRLGIPSGQGLENCMAVHAEQNALLQCPDTRIIDTIYVSTAPCLTCVKLLLNTGCKRIVYVDEYETEGKELWEKSNRIWERIFCNPSVMDFTIDLIPLIYREGSK